MKRVPPGRGAAAHRPPAAAATTGPPRETPASGPLRPVARRPRSGGLPPEAGEDLFGRCRLVLIASDKCPSR